MTLEQYRRKNQLTHQSMADLLKISKSYYEKIESGNKIPGRDTISVIKEKCPDVDINIFLKTNHT